MRFLQWSADPAELYCCFVCAPFGVFCGNVCVVILGKFVGISTTVSEYIRLTHYRLDARCIFLSVRQETSYPSNSVAKSAKLECNLICIEAKIKASAITGRCKYNDAGGLHKSEQLVHRVATDRNC